jgi:hypothetical protein
VTALTDIYLSNKPIPSKYEPNKLVTVIRPFWATRTPSPSMLIVQEAKSCQLVSFGAWTVAEENNKAFRECNNKLEMQGIGFKDLLPR